MHAQAELIGPALPTIWELGGQLKHSSACKNVPSLHVQFVTAIELNGDVDRA
jgi:hypothetical protein